MAVKGVDISEFNGAVDFQALKNAGVQFVIIRCGFGSDYPGQQDKRFEENIQKAEAAGMPWGVYHYSYATGKQGGVDEARHCLRLLKGRKPLYGVWLDMEDNSTLGGDLAGAAQGFCNTIEGAGLYCGVYASVSWWKNHLASPAFDKYDRWAAQYYSACQCEKPYGMWQYTDKWSIGGKDFDGNWAYKDYPSLTKGDSMAKSRVLQTQENKATRGFGNGHSGVDLGWQTTQTDGILAHSDGTVTFCQTGCVNDQGASGNASYGNCVKVKHPNGYSTLYAHLSAVTVKNGQSVKKGQQIGNMGNTGNSYGSHLHFEVRNTSDTCIDPAPYLAADLPGLKTETETEEKDMTEAEARKIAQDEIAKYFAALEKKPVSGWAQGHVDTVKERGIMNGDTDGNFRPQDVITREEVAATLVNALGIGKEPSDWAKEAFEKATAAGIMDGTMPREALTREQFAVILDKLGLIPKAAEK